MDANKKSSARRRHNGEEGLSLIEVLIAMLIFSLVLVALTSSIISSTSADLTVHEGDQVSVSAYSALALANAESCGEAVTGASGQGGCYDQTTWTAPIPSSAATLVTSATVVSTWVCAASSSGSPATTSPCTWGTGGSAVDAACPTSSESASITTPTSLQRTVTVIWSFHGSSRSRSLTAYDSVPSTDLAVASGSKGYLPGGILVCGTSAPVTLTTSSGSTVTRPSSGQTVWFPYLAPGSYTISSSASPVTVTAGELTEVSA